MRYMLRDWVQYRPPFMPMITAQGSSAIQAGGFYRGTVYPPQYQGALFFSDYNGDWIHYLTFDANGVATKFDFGTDVARLLAGSCNCLLVRTQIFIMWPTMGRHQTPAKSVVFVILPGETVLLLPMQALTLPLVMCH